MAKIKLVIFDINHTLIDDNSWEKLNTAFGMTREEDERLWLANQKGELSNSQWVREVNAIFKSHKQANFDKYLEVCNSYTWKPGARKIVKTLKEAGYRIALISGAPDEVVHSITSNLGGIDYKYSGADVVFDKNGTFVSFTYHDEEEKLKQKQLQDLARDSGIDPSEMAVVADGANDKPLFEKCGVSITFKNSKLESIATNIVSSLPEIETILLPI
ncbi:HAD family phosphatase [Candidatus Saccharibacteria bacterium]|nr:MAG: HAD family phosphatase [Candidatus Saccharibacteria bacterium]